MRNRSFITPLLRRWHAERAQRPWLPAALVLLALNAAYFVWSRGASAAEGERPLPDVKPASIVLFTPEEGQHRQALAQAQAAARNKSAPAPDMLVEFEVTPAKEIPPDR